MVLADPTQIHQVIVNLCTNAYHAMRETGGTLAVSVAEIEIQGEDEGDDSLVPGRYLKLEVSNTGGGISPEIQDKIFEPYFTTKKTGEGTGLGLAVVHGIVKSHHGHITVCSEPGTGTTFRVYLPLVENEGQAVEPPEKESIADLSGKGERILFVDDEEQIRAFAEILFSGHGYQVRTFADGLQALAEFRNHPDRFDLVITDMTMPHITGAELAQKIISLRPDIPIILCTGQSELIDREKAFAMGMCAYLNKPVLQHDFLSAVRKALEQK
jgi:CheY-like chemotaxis protein